MFRFVFQKNARAVKIFRGRRGKKEKKRKKKKHRESLIKREKSIVHQVEMQCTHDKRNGKCTLTAWRISCKLEYEKHL